MNITNRQKQIFKILIQEYIRSANPVSSSYISNRVKNCSSATIRNELMILEHIGLITKKFNVSGRIPTSDGYKYYVEYIMKLDNKLLEVKSKINNILSSRINSIDEIIETSCNIISNSVSVITLNNSHINSDETVKKIDFVQISDTSSMLLVITSSGNIYKNSFNFLSKKDIVDIYECISFFNRYLVNTGIYGLSNKIMQLKKIGKQFIIEHELVLQKIVGAILDNIHPIHTITGLNNIIKRNEFHDYKKLEELSKLLETKSIWKLLKPSEHAKKIKLMIGSEISKNIKDIAAITKNYKTSSGKQGQIALLGPQRLEYDNLYDLLNWFVNKIESL